MQLVFVSHSSLVRMILNLSLYFSRIFSPRESSYLCWQQFCVHLATIKYPPKEKLIRGKVTFIKTWLIRTFDIFFDFDFVEIGIWVLADINRLTRPRRNLILQSTRFNPINRTREYNKIFRYLIAKEISLIHLHFDIILNGY